MEEQQYFNFNQVKLILNHDFSKDYFYKMEKRNEIPQATRRGSSYRYWTIKNIAEIGKKFRTLSKLHDDKRPLKMSFYLTKGGGSHKSTTAFNLARYYALMGIKTLLIPLDFQMNMSKRLGMDNTPSVIKSRGSYFKGLFECFDGNLDVRESIHKTGFPNIDIIPESRQLVRLEVLLNSISYSRETALKQLLAPIESEYELIIFDNSPNWNILSVNSIVACNALVSPIGCDSNSLDTIELFNSTIDDQLKGLKMVDRIFIAGFTENNALKKQILEIYHENYGNYFLRNDVRKSTSVDEANAQNISIYEYAPRSAVCEDYKKVAIELWERAVRKMNASEMEQKQ